MYTPDYYFNTWFGVKKVVEGRGDVPSDAPVQWQLPRVSPYFGQTQVGDILDYLQQRIEVSASGEAQRMSETQQISLNNYTNVTDVIYQFGCYTEPLWCTFVMFLIYFCFAMKIGFR